MEELKGQDLKGGFSNGVVESNAWRRYVGDGTSVFGYIGASGRTSLLDEMLEHELRNQGLGDEGIATWLTSGDGRHLMDDMPDTITKQKNRIKEYTKNAFKDVTVWSHPDHEGTLSSTIKLTEKIFGKR
jgi:hypothetical protein